jgi:hypothetical protein
MSAVIGLSVLLLGVSGCSGSGPSPADPTSAHPGTAPGSPSASATPTQDPGQAAIAAVQRMFDAYNAMLKSGSSKAYRATFTKDCQDCLNDANTAEAIFGRHQSIEGGAYVLTDLVVDHFYPDLKVVTLEGLVSQSSVRIIDHGRVIDHFAGFKHMPVGWNVSHVNGQWLVSRGTVLR